MLGHLWLTPKEVESTRLDRASRRTGLERRQRAELREARRNRRERGE